VLLTLFCLHSENYFLHLKSSDDLVGPVAEVAMDIKLLSVKAES